MLEITRTEQNKTKKLSSFIIYLGTNFGKTSRH